MGFRTLAIEKRSSEIWALLGAVKTEFGNFADVLKKTKDKLDKASSEIDKASARSRTIERKLRDVQVLPTAEAVELIGETIEEDEVIGESSEETITKDADKDEKKDENGQLNLINNQT
jgi:DNA recombination protein RmuC